MINNLSNKLQSNLLILGLSSKYKKNIKNKVKSLWLKPKKSKNKSYKNKIRKMRLNNK